LSENAPTVGREIIGKTRRLGLLVVIRTKIINAVLASTLLAAVAVGTEMLVSDTWLWSAAPTHAMGLLGLTVLGLFFAFGVLKLPTQYARYARLTFAGAALLAAVQLLLMVGDTIVGAPGGVPQDAFRAYLLSDPAFVTLLGIQPITLLTGLAATMTVTRKRKPVEVETRQQIEVPAMVP
jgi:hypothetical protein